MDRDDSTGRHGPLLCASVGKPSKRMAAAWVLQVPSSSSGKEDPTMLYWAAVFFVIAIVAAILGFGGLAAGAASIAKVLFVVFLILTAVSLLVGRRTLV
jgi:uncharacterized membrane protein YtjA (UPF0391 family)